MSSVIIKVRVQAEILRNQSLISGRGRDFSLLHNMLTYSRANLASCPTDKCGLFSGSNFFGGVVLTSHLHIVPHVKKAWSYTSTSGCVSQWVMISVIILCMLSFYRCIFLNMIILCNSWEVLCPLHLLFTPNFSVCISTVSVGSLPVLLHNWWQVLSQVCPLVIAQILLHNSFNQQEAHVATLIFCLNFVNLLLPRCWMYCSYKDLECAFGN